jgi:hypothetical protein
LDAGDHSIDITDEKFIDISFDMAIADNLDKWTRISNDLGFCNSLDPKKCENKKAYMVYLWLNTLYKNTFMREPEGGNLQMGIVPTLGSAGFLQWMTVMRFEFPAIVYAHAL